MCKGYQNYRTGILSPKGTGSYVTYVSLQMDTNTKGLVLFEVYLMTVVQDSGGCMRMKKENPEELELI